MGLIEMSDIERAERERHARNLRPTPEARAAMFLWPDEYAKSGLGSMDFWDGLSDRRKMYARDMVSAVGEQAAARIKELEGDLEKAERALELLRKMRHGAARARDAALAENERLREALEPFARALGEFGDDGTEHRDRCNIFETGIAMLITFGHLRKARAALKGEPHGN